MLPFENLIIIDKDRPIPVFKQITNRIIELIRDGRLKPGIYLPGTRQMAQILNVNRKTVIKSYDEMLGENWIETVMRKGYRVMPDLPLLKPRSFQPKTYFSLHGHKEAFTTQDIKVIRTGGYMKSSDVLVDDGFPDPSLIRHRDFNKASIGDDRGFYPGRVLAPRPVGGSAAVRESTSVFLNDSRGLNISEREIMMTRGGKMPLYLAANILINKGDIVALSDKSDTLPIEIIEHAGGDVIYIHTDGEGIDPAHLEEVLRKTKIKMLYLVPHCHYPTTVVMGAERRRRLLELMIAFDFWIVEDDYAYDFHYQNSPILPLASSAHNGKVVYIGSFDKIISPSVGLGFFVASPEIITKAIHLQGLIDQNGDAQMEHLLLTMMENRGIERQIMRCRKIYAHRCDLICELLRENLGHLIKFDKPKAGLAVYIKFEDRFPLGRFVKDSSDFGLFFNGTLVDNFAHRPEKAIRLGFASLTIKEMETAVEIMVKVINKLVSVSKNYSMSNLSPSAISAYAS